MSRLTRGVKAGIQMADSLVEWIHMMYNKDTAVRVLDAMIKRLEEKRDEFKQGFGKKMKHQQKGILTSKIVFDITSIYPYHDKVGGVAYEL